MNGKKSIRLGLAGDLMLGGEAIRYAQACGLALNFPFDSLLPTLAGLDVLFVNLEGPLFENPSRAMRKALLLSNHRAVIEVLKQPGLCVCNLANNHSLDFGADALLRTQRHLDGHGIQHIGAGRTAREAGRELVVERSGWRIGCLAFSESWPALDTVIAGPRRTGCARLPERAALLERVRRLRRQVDMVVVMLHWGREFHEYPTPAQVRLARALVDAGADIIAGHHPHAIQAIEEYRGSVIAYSLGHLYMPPFRLTLGRKAGHGAPRVRRAANGKPTDTSGTSHGKTQSVEGSHNGPVFYPRPASKEFLLMRVEVPREFPDAPGSVDLVAGGMDACFKLRPYNRIGLQAIRSRLDDLACPLRNGSYAKFWRHYRHWRPRELEWLCSPAASATKSEKRK